MTPVEFERSVAAMYDALGARSLRIAVHGRRARATVSAQRSGGSPRIDDASRMVDEIVVHRVGRTLDVAQLLEER